MECKALDGQVARRDPKIADLLDKFVCVRVIQANGMDLSLFQFDQDLTWAVFFLNADRTVYGRYGSRTSQKDALREISIEGFGKALAGALELHKDHPKNQAALAGKIGPKPEFATPEMYPLLKGKYQAKLAEGAAVRKSCIHCHQVHNAQRQVLRSSGKPMADEALWLYPMPDWLGLVCDPKEKATVQNVTAGSTAAKDGFQPRDELVRLAGQPLLSIADIQWVLENAKEGKVAAEVNRGGKKLDLSLTLSPGWRRKGDFSWRSSTWDLRRMATGGLVFEELPAEERKTAKVEDSALALRIKHVGQFGAHAAGKNAGFQKGDIVLEFDGLAQRQTESELIAHVLQKKKVGDKMPVTVLRAGQKQKLQLPVQ